MKKHTIENRKTRGAIARNFILDVLSNPNHQMYAASDVEFAKMLNVTRLTVYNIRKELVLKSRKKRVIELIDREDISSMTMKDLSFKLNLKYQNIYQLTKKLGLKTLPDKKPIDFMLEHQRSKSKSTNGKESLNEY